MFKNLFIRLRDQLALVPPTIWALGFVTMFINISTVMVFGYSALYISTILGIAMSGIGVLEGIVEGVAYLLKLFSGVISDYLKGRKKLVLLGCILVALSRPLLAISASFSAVFGARLLDRIGNGVQSTPRDALVGDWAPSQHKGASFGLRQTLGTSGSFLGGILGMWAMKATNGAYHKVFWLSSIPALIGILILYFFVQDVKKNDQNDIPAPQSQPLTQQRTPKFSWSDLASLGGSYWALMIVAGTFMLARLADSFLILYANKNFGLLQEEGPKILMLYNAAYALCSYPIGRFSDRFSRYKILAAGIFILVFTDLMLWSAPSLEVVFGAVFLWGVQMAITQSMFLALIADMVPKNLRGTGFGVFYFISAIALTTASTVGGNVAKIYSLSNAYLMSAIVASFALVSLVVVMKWGKRKNI